MFGRRSIPSGGVARPFHTRSMRSPRALPDRCLSTQTGKVILARTLSGDETFLYFARCAKGPSRNNRDNWEAQICDRGKARRGSRAGLCDRGATPPRAKDGPPRRAGRFWAPPASLIASILPVCALFAPWLAPKSSRPIVPVIS